MAKCSVAPGGALGREGALGGNPNKVRSLLNRLGFFLPRFLKARHMQLTAVEKEKRGLTLT